MNKIGWKDLFDFGDGDSLNVIFQNIERLQVTYLKMVESIESSNKRLATEFTGLKGESQKLLQGVNSMTGSFETYEKQLLDSAKASEELVGKNQALKKIEGDNTKALQALETELNNVNKAKERMKGLTDAEAGSLDDLRKKLQTAQKEYAALGDSADESIKEQHLQKVRDAAQQYNTVNKSLNDAKKASVVAAGSYNELSKRVADARKKLKEMEGGINGNSKEFKELQKYIQEGDTQLKAFDKSIGQSQRNVGNYESALDGLDQVTGGVIGQFKALGNQLKALATNPWFLLVATLVATFAALTTAVKTYWAATGEGEDRLALQKTAWSQFFSTLKKGWSDLGESIADLLPDSKVIINGLFAGLAANIPGISGWLFKMQADFNKTVGDAEELTKAVDVLGDKIIDNIIRQAETTRDFNALLLKAEDKVKFSDEQRLAFLRSAIRLKEDQLKIDVEYARENAKHVLHEVGLEHALTNAQAERLTQQERMAIFTEVEMRKIAEATAQAIDLEGQFAQEAKRGATKIVALQLEIEKAKRDAANRAKDSELAVQKFLYEENIRYNDLIAEDENSTMEERVQAIEASAISRREALELDKRNELELVRRTAEERIRAEGKEVTDALLAEDVALQNQRDLINEKYKELVKNTDKELQDRLEKNVFTMLNRDFDKLSDGMSTISSSELKGLNDAFMSGEISNIDKFNKRKEDLQREHQMKVYQSQLKHLKERVDLLRIYGHDVTAIEREIAAVELAISNQNVNRQIENERILQEAVKNLKQAAHDGALQILANINERQNMEHDKEIAMLEEKNRREIELAGDNELAKAQINERFERKVDEINKKRAQENRRRAIFEKALAITQIGVNTAKAISEVLPNYILAAIIAATGAIQIAAVASKPIPQYEVGTTNSVEGWAIVNESGKEIVVPKHGSPYMYDTEGATMAYLQGGSQVITADESAKILEGDKFDGMTGMFNKDADSIERHLIDRNERAVVLAIDRNFNRLHSDNARMIEAITEQRYPDLVQQGSLINKVYIDQSKNKKIVRSKSMTE